MVKGARVELSDLLLVTGCDKTAGWAVAAFTEHQRGASISFEGGYTPVAGGGFSLSGSWSSTSFVQHREGPPSSADQWAILPTSSNLIASSEASPPVCYDQCVFVRGLRCKARPLRAPKVIEAAAEPRDDPPLPKDSDDDDIWNDTDNLSDYSIEDLDGGQVGSSQRV